LTGTRSVYLLLPRGARGAATGFELNTAAKRERLARARILGGGREHAGAETLSGRTQHRYPAAPSANGWRHPNTVYRRACTGGTGMCNGHTVAWSQLETAVNGTSFSSNKKANWLDNGNAYGVDS
jgi:hypothetical protein